MKRSKFTKEQIAFALNRSIAKLKNPVLKGYL